MDRHLQDKLQQFSATPPEGVWNKVADALDEKEIYSQRLYQYEEAPPSASWSVIQENLDQTVPAKVIPLQRRLGKPMRYAAVAVFLTILLVAITLVVRRTETGTLDASADNTPLSSSPVIQPSPAQADEISSIETRPISSDSQSNPPAFTQKQPDIASVDEIKKPTIKSPVYSSLSDYVVFSDGDGKMRKVSRKLAGFVNCKENDLPCQQRLRELRQRMAANAMTTDFAGVLELLRHMQ